MQSYPESAGPLITTLFKSYLALWLFILVVFEIFRGFHQDPHTAVRSKPDHPSSPPPSKHIAAKTMTSTTVIT